MTRVLLILGPTASGKSALALALAGQIGGEIVNADSMQVYRDLRVLTARPSPAEEAQAPHHLYGVVDAAERFSAGAWLRAARPVLADIAGRGKHAIVVGGTGLYFNALLGGLDEIPEPPADLRAALAAQNAAVGAEAMHERLAALDAEAAAKIGPRDTPRVLRALAVRLHTGRSILSWRSREGTAGVSPAVGPHFGSGAHPSPLRIALTPPRDALYAAIEARFDAMLAAGTLGEVRALAGRGLDPALPALKAHGMPWLAAHLRGELTLAAAIERAIRDTRRYAKRQFTWIAHQTPDWPRVTAVTLEDRLTHVLALQKALDRRSEAN